MAMRFIAAAVVAGVVQVVAGQSATIVTITQRDAWQSPMDAPSAAISADGRVTLDSVAPAGRESDIAGANPGISEDGRYLVFQSDDAIAFRDHAEATTTLLGAGSDPAISGDGRTVAFASSATDVVPGTDANGSGDDVYLVDVGTGVTRRVSVDGGGNQSPTGASVGPSVSADGRYVAFASTAPFHGGSPPRVSDAARAPATSIIYVYDARLGTTKPVGPARAGKLPEADSWGPC
ncbi:MAG: hypothetical protein EXQ48_01585 [Acidobacteria bacterium]|nr:hypothetical protein [Acidobacteriota bacterium]